MDELLLSLRVALSETWSFYFKAHVFHWNVRGPLFRQFHKFFGEIYEDVFAAVDGLAEEIRALGALAPTSLDDIAAAASIKFTDVPSAAEMLQQLIVDNDTVITALETANAAAIEARQDGLTNFLEARLDAHKKWGWMLKATISEDVGA